MYLDYAERQARRGNVMYMADWVKRLDAFLQFNEEDILHDKGKVTAAIAKAVGEKSLIGDGLFHGSCHQNCVHPSRHLSVFADLATDGFD